MPTLWRVACSVDAAPSPKLRQADCTVSWDAPEGPIPLTRSIGRGASLSHRQPKEAPIDQPKLGIDVSKDTLDVNVIIAGKPLAKPFANSDLGHQALIAWLRHRKLGQVHACMEATGRYSLGVATALHAAGHLVSIVNPAQIRDFTRTRLGRNKTDQVDSVFIRQYAELFQPPAWQPPSPALRRLCDLQAMRAGFVASRVEWHNRASSLAADPDADALAAATIAHFTDQIAAVEQAIGAIIDGDDDLRRKRDLLLSIKGVGNALAAVILAELPGPETVSSSGQAVAYAGLNPSRYQSGSSINRPTRISKIGNATLRTALFMPAMVAIRHNKAVAALAERLRAQGRLNGKQIVVAAMRKLLVICFGVLKSGQPFDPAKAMPQ